MKTILENFLDALNVGYTKHFIQTLYQEHPHKYNMLGLKKILDVYGVRTLGVRIESKDLSSLNYPCILHTHGDFVIGLDSDASTITFLQHGKETTLTHDIFRQTWTGNALVVQETTNAAEPDYKEHQRNELAAVAKAYSVPFQLMVAVAIGMASNLEKIGVFEISRILLSLLGILVCGMLMEKQLYEKSRYGDRICSLFHHADCNSILDGPKAKVFGISWSEVGLGYFTAVILLLSLFPPSSVPVAVINGVAMLYGVWSVYYQWRVAKSWCVLCVMAQSIIWAMGITAAASYLNNPCVPNIIAGLLSCIVFAVSILTIHQYASAYSAEKERVHTVQQYRALKANHTVAKALIEQGEFHEITVNDSSIVFGNPTAKTRVTILSNPHCNPCAKMHRRVEKLLSVYGNELCVQYVFSSFSEQLEDSSRYLISCYLNHSENEALRRFELWYTKEKFDYESIVRQNEVCIHTEMIEKEMKKHANWREKTALTATPTVLINGYILPKEYELEDLAMFANTDIT